MSDADTDVVEALGELIKMLDHYRHENFGRHNHMDAITHSSTLRVAREAYLRALQRGQALGSAAEK